MVLKANNACCYDRMCQARFRAIFGSPKWLPRWYDWEAWKGEERGVIAW